VLDVGFEVPMTQLQQQMNLWKFVESVLAHKRRQVGHGFSIKFTS
jgi:hypothetical protein